VTRGPMLPHPLDPPISVHGHIALHPTLGRGIGGIVAIEEVVAGQVFKGRPDTSSSRIGLTSLCTFWDSVWRQRRWSEA
jgi:hypothetical protein